MPMRIRDKGEKDTQYPQTYDYIVSSSDSEGVYPAVPEYDVSTETATFSSSSRQHFEDYVCDPELKCGKVNRYKPVINNKTTYSNFGPVHVAGEATRFDTPEHPLARVNLISWWNLPLGEDYTRGRMDSAFASNSEVLNSFYSSDELASAIRQLSAQIEGRIDSTNVYAILLEAVDLRNLIPGLLGNLSSTISKEMVSGDLKDKWLSWNWGFVPLMNDIDNINALFLKIEMLFQKWNDFARQGKIMSFHASVFKQSVGGTYTETYNLSGAYLNRLDYSTQYLGSVDSRLSLYIKPELMDQNAIINFRNNKLGLYKPIAGIYEATRLSWLVDYFSNVGDFLESFEDSLTGAIMKYSVVDFGVSVKTTKWANMRIYSNYHYSNVKTRDETLEETMYERIPLDPASFKILGIDKIEFDYSLSPVQITNLGAVIRT